MNRIISELKELPPRARDRLLPGGNALAFAVPGHPVGQEHEAARAGGGRRRADRTGDYYQYAGWHCVKGLADCKGQGSWPYEGDVWLDVEIYYLRKWPRPDPENVVASLQDAFTGILWKNDLNVLGRVNYHWYPGKTPDRIPSQLFEGRRYIGGVLVAVTKI